MNTTSELLLWVAVPYVWLAVFAVGHVWRYRQDQFGWTSRTSQLLEHRRLRWGGPLFHLGAFMVIAGHVVGLAVPDTWTEAVGITEHAQGIVPAPRAVLDVLRDTHWMLLVTWYRAGAPSAA